MADELVKVAEYSARGGFFLVLGTAIATVIMAISSILVGRLLGPELYGQYALALVVPQLLYLFTDLGVNQGIIKLTANLNSKGETGRAARIVRCGLLLKAATGIFVFIILFALADSLALFFLNRPDMGFYIRIASISILFQTIFATATSAFVGLDKTEYNALATNIQAIAKTVTSVALVLIGFGVLGALVGHVASYTVGAIISASILLFMLPQKQIDKNNSHLKDNIKTLVSYGTPLYISLLLTGFIPLYQNVILAIFTTDSDIGNFKAASNFATLMTVLSIPITTALLSAFSKLNSSTNHKISRFFKITNKYTSLIIIPITVFIIMFSREIVEIIYGSTYQSAWLFLAVYCVLYLLVGIGYLSLTSLYNGLGETRMTLKISLISFLAVTVLSPILTRWYGVPGLIIAFLIANTAGTLYGSYNARKRYQIEFDACSIKKIYAISALSAVPSLVLIVFTSPSALVSFIVGGALYLSVYATAILKTRIITNRELQMARQITDIKPLAFVCGLLIKYQRILHVATK